MVSFKYFKRKKETSEVQEISRSQAYAELKRITNMDAVTIGTVLSYKPIETPKYTYYAEKINIAGPPKG